MPSCDVQAALKVALELQDDVCVRRFWEHAAVAAGMNPFSPALIARNGCTAGFQPDPSMRSQRNRRLGLLVESRHSG